MSTNVDADKERVKCFESWKKVQEHSHSALSRFSERPVFSSQLVFFSTPLEKISPPNEIFSFLLQMFSTLFFVSRISDKEQVSP